MPPLQSGKNVPSSTAVLATSWVTLGDAFKAVLKAIDRQFGNAPREGADELNSSFQENLRLIIINLPGAFISDDSTVRPTMTSKSKSFADGGSWCVEDQPPSKHRNNRKVLSLQEVALAKAHFELMRLLQTGAVPARSQMRSALLTSVSGEKPKLENTPRETWTSCVRVRRKNKPNFALGLVPDYLNSRIAEFTDMKSKRNFDFNDIEVDGTVLTSYLKLRQPAVTVTGGKFRVVKQRDGFLLEVQCCNWVARVEPTLGLAALGILLSFPNEPVDWKQLHGAACYFLEGQPPKSSFKHGNQRFDVATEDHSGPLFDPSELKRRWNEIVIHQERVSKMRLEKRVLEEKALEFEISQWKKDLNSSKRRPHSNDKHRMNVYKLIEGAIVQLAVVCPPLAGHLGMLSPMSERRSLKTHMLQSKISYEPNSEVKWDTEPLTAA